MMFFVPTSAAGDYTLNVRAAFAPNDVRRGTLDTTLTVA